MGILLIDQYIEDGAKYLDEIDPQWFQKVNMAKGRFNIKNTNLCILGQLYGDYYEALDKLGLDHWTAGSYGLAVSADSCQVFKGITKEDYRLLWNKEVKKREQLAAS